MKKLFLILLSFSLLFSLVACGDKEEQETNNELTAPAVWKDVRGSFARQDSSQYNNATLQMLYLDNGCVMFEFKLMEGSESEDASRDIVVPGVLVVSENNVGEFESDPDVESSLSITMTISDDGKTVTAKHSGEMPISCDGVYDFVDEGIEVSEYSAASILRFLPTVMTSLNSSSGEYDLAYSEEVVANWFYPVEAVFRDNGVKLAKFVISKDMSAVYRVDDDIEPVLIFGSAQPMLDYEALVYSDEEQDEDLEDMPEFQPIAWVESEEGVTLTPEAKTNLIAVLPWELNYSFESLSSSDKDVISVDEYGSITAVKAGKATVTGKLVVDDAGRDFTVEFVVTSSSGDTPDTEDDSGK